MTPSRPCLEFLLELGYLHRLRQQVLADRPHRRRLEELGRETRRGRASERVERNLAGVTLLGLDEHKRVKVCFSTELL